MLPVLLARVELKGATGQIAAVQLLEPAEHPLRPCRPLPGPHALEGLLVGLEPLVQRDQTVLGGEDVDHVGVRLHVGQGLGEEMGGAVQLPGRGRVAGLGFRAADQGDALLLCHAVVTSLL